ncbi:hypothetical protein GWI33_005162 [Rhynchophorus ferrugineus]|uniref:Uncharacterized protein n=1 Tax=Rhynchophorus ferrugineus TaxID=354439 RepID=A0A834IJQ6_RHYFE|nr:hypothetical protein GWI33_005162 [Rhynchophorus ferrugineus]
MLALFPDRSKNRVDHEGGCCVSSRQIADELWRRRTYKIVPQKYMGGSIVMVAWRRDKRGRKIYTPGEVLDVFDNDQLVLSGYWKQKLYSGFFPLKDLPRRIPRNLIEVK